MAISINVSSNVITVSGGTGSVTDLRTAISRIRWVSKGATAGDTCLISDQNSGTLFESEATGANWQDEVELGKVAPVDGVQISTLTSGIVYIYLR